MQSSLGRNNLVQAVADYHHHVIGRQVRNRRVVFAVRVGLQAVVVRKLSERKVCASTFDQDSGQTRFQLRPVA